MPWIRAKKEEGDFEGEFWNGEEEKQIEGIVEEVKIGAYNKYFMKIQTKENIKSILKHFEKKKNLTNEEKTILEYLNQGI